MVMSTAFAFGSASLTDPFWTCFWLILAAPGMWTFAVLHVRRKWAEAYQRACEK